MSTETMLPLTITPADDGARHRSSTSQRATPDEHHYSRPASRGSSPKPLPTGLPLGLHSSERWPARNTARGIWTSWANGSASTGRHGRQKSLSEAIQTVRTRKMSISENAHEIADSLRAPVSLKLVLLCAFWYMSSIMTNTSSKSILTALPKPVTLTVVQFLLVSFWCLVLSWLAKSASSVRDTLPVLKHGIRRPSREIILCVLPLTAFQIGGHILNSDAMSRIPVSLVHTIKGLSPLMTVMAYRVFFNVKYSIPTYLSLIPLTLGVVLACSASFRANLLGLIYAFGSAILFVTQNIVSKKIFNESDRAEADGTPVGRRKPDKLNLLCYSSMLALIITLPIWVWTEGWVLLTDYFHDSSITLSGRPGSFDHGRLILEFIFNGTFHFGQSMVAFVLLGMVSPVTYSVASLIKRVVVIMFAIVWFGNPMTSVQGFGFLLTFIGLYLYDRTSDAAKADKRAQEKEATEDHLLPLNLGDLKKNDDESAVYTDSPQSADMPRRSFGNGKRGEPNGHANGTPRPGGTATPSNMNGVPESLPPGTKAQETWSQADVARQQQQPSSLSVSVR
ncbi:TPT-domain-containing protein [Teratosphaeria nubilosa]|uniref:TPT-domain-containing protein n=1 Tax=Teratosphaeria nubilosa TaxID=161662 RepID=A0A6G1LCS7_9PEZI|nr:TPT-domain-containing protein [Teratosphaeria nubilosa]